ncbi:hypothetical protein SB861_37505, partial [Paraburkholderia sp. SIMBA_049]
MGDVHRVGVRRMASVVIGSSGHGLTLAGRVCASVAVGADAAAALAAGGAEAGVAGVPGAPGAALTTLMCASDDTRIAPSTTTRSPA